MSPFSLRQSDNSGLSRLAKWFQQRVFTRNAAIHLLTHLVVSLFLHTALRSLGVPEWVTLLVTAVVLVVVETAIDDCMNKEVAV